MDGKNLDDYGDGSEYKSTRWKFFSVLLAIIVVVLFLFIGARWYQAEQGRQKFENGLKQQEQYYAEIEKQKMADIYGGKTPQETLRLYIDAVEKGDYELASKYFVVGKKDAELKSLEGHEPQYFSKYLNNLKQDFSSSLDCSEDKKQCSINRPFGIDFVLYPNGIWKIEEI